MYYLYKKLLLQWTFEHLKNLFIKMKLWHVKTGQTVYNLKQNIFMFEAKAQYLINHTKM